MGSRNKGSWWSDLPQELLETIADRLGNKTDVSRVRSVCESWRFSIKPFQEPISFPLNVPYLGPLNDIQTFLVLSQTTLYHLSQTSSSSSTQGWLVKLGEYGQSGGQSQRHVLVNPLSPLRIQPLPDTFPKVIDSSKFRVSELAKAYTLQFSNGGYCNYKVAVALNLDYPPTIMIVASGVLWGLKLKGQDKWRPIDDMSSQLFYEDVVLYRGKFCAVDEVGRAVEVDSLSLGFTEIARPMGNSGGVKNSLVVSGEDLLLVDAYRRRGQAGSMERFRVFKLNADEKRWIEMQSLDDRILFLGEDCSFSVLARGLGGGCMGNCIVYRDPFFMVFGLDGGKVSSMNLKPEYANIFYPPPST